MNRWVGREESLNSKPETLNSKQARMLKIEMSQTNKNVFKLWDLNLGFVSDFEIRISDFRPTASAP
jgi:hypothetical protein